MCFITRNVLRKGMEETRRQEVLSQLAGNGRTVMRKRRLTIVQRGWRSELMLRAQACRGFTSVSTNDAKPFTRCRSLKDAES